MSSIHPASDSGAQPESAAASDPAPSVSAPDPGVGGGGGTWWPLCALFVPFVANDIGNIYVRSAPLWVAQDYAWRLLVLGLLVYFWRRGSVATEPFRWRVTGWLPLVAWTLFITAAGLWLVDGPGRQLHQLWPQTRIGFIPAIHSPGLRLFDLTFGLALVAVSEEFVFRGVLLPRLAKWLRSETAGLLVSSLLFGLAHWSTGAGAVLQTTLAGVLLGLCTLRTRMLYPAVLAHYVINLAAFS